MLFAGVGFVSGLGSLSSLKISKSYSSYWMDCGELLIKVATSKYAMLGRKIKIKSQVVE